MVKRLVRDQLSSGNESGRNAEAGKNAGKAGAEFEIEFMQMMTKHHLKAIREASKCVDRVYHAELRELCENIITTQAVEIRQMRTCLCQWYGIVGADIK